MDIVYQFFTKTSIDIIANNAKLVNKEGLYNIKCGAKVKSSGKISCINEFPNSAKK